MIFSNIKKAPALITFPLNVNITIYSKFTNDENNTRVISCTYKCKKNNVRDTPDNFHHYRKSPKHRYCRRLNCYIQCKI